MAQLIYSIGALLLTVLFSLQLHQNLIFSERSVYLNEAATQLSEIARDILGDVAQRRVAFDRATNEGLMTNPSFPMVTSSGQLTTDGGTFWGCAAAACCTNIKLCQDIDDYDGVTLMRSVEGLNYRVDISVGYVMESDITQTSSTQTFVKQATVRVTNPTILVASDTLRVSMSRAFGYQRITQVVVVP